MKKIFLAIALTFIGFGCLAQEKKIFVDWVWLIGEWRGEGDGQPGKGNGTFTFQPDLDKKIFVRKNHSEYPATKEKPKIEHDDLMIVYPDSSGSSKAIYFDNEGHVINYTVAVTPTTIIMTSDKIPNVPIFRLTYTLLGYKAVTVKFEMSQDGEKFMTYTEGKCVREK